MGRKIKESDHYFKTVRKKTQMLDRMDKSIVKKRRETQCDCLHTNENGYALRIAKRSKEDVVLECRLCGKRIYVNRLPEDIAAQGIKTADMMCDMVKMHLNIRRKEDVKTADMVSFIQYNILYKLGLLYAAIINRQDNNNKNFNSSMYGKTIVRRK